MIRSLLLVILSATIGSVAYWQYRAYQRCEEVDGIALRGFWGNVVCFEVRPKQRP